MSKVSYMKIRMAKNSDCQKLYKLHVASIAFYCSNVYPKEALKEWINSKSISDYQFSTNTICLIAEAKDSILGFGLLNLLKNSIDSLYLAPCQAGKGLGSLLLNRLEAIAKAKGILQIELNSTPNAFDFYIHMGYKKLESTIYKLPSGVKLDCIKMNKILST